MQQQRGMARRSMVCKVIDRNTKDAGAYFRVRGSYREGVSILGRRRSSLCWCSLEVNKKVKTWPGFVMIIMANILA